MNKPTILQISPFFAPNIGGVETHLNDLLTILNANKFKNIVVTYQPLMGKIKGASYEKRSNTQIYRTAWFKGIFYKTEKIPWLHFLYLTPGLLLKSFIILKNKNKNIDIIHAHGVNAAIIGMYLKMIYKKPLIISFHVEFNLAKKSLSTNYIVKSLKAADKILVLTDRSKQSLLNLGIQKEKIVTYSYWVDQSIFKPLRELSLRKKITKNDNFTILFVGRLAKEKGIELLVEAAKKLPQVNFILIGTGELDMQLKKQSQQINNLFYLGRIENHRLPGYYNSADVLIVPSLTKDPKPEYEEGVPRVMIEALSCGLPIIGTDNGGIKEVINKGKIGLVIDCNANSLIKAINQLMHSPTKLKSLSLKSRSFATEYFGKKNSEIISTAYLQEFYLLKQGLKLKELLAKVGDMALKRRAKSIISALQLDVNKKILDVGCGDGFYLHLLSNLDPSLNLSGTDLDENGLKSARRNVNSRIRLYQADLMKKLPFKDNEFDGVIMSEVAEHLPQDKTGLKEVARIIKPGGVLALTVPCQDYPIFWDPINWVLEHVLSRHVQSGFWAGIWNQHVRLYHKQQIEKVIDSAALKVEQSQVQTFWCLPFSHYLINLGARLLVSGRLPATIKDSASKFSTKNEQKINLATLFLFLANLIDRLNEIIPTRQDGVSIFVKAKKS